MKNILSSTGHALLALGVSGLGLALAGTQNGLITGKGALVVVGLGVLYQAITGKALQVTIPTDAPAVAPAPVVAAPVAAAPVVVPVAPVSVPPANTGISVVQH